MVTALEICIQATRVSQLIEDPVVRSARREAIWAVVVWAAAASYTIGYCYLLGYAARPLAEVTFILWFPDWVFWGIVTPWFLATVVTIFFAYRVMGDEPLGPEQIDPDPPASGAIEVDRA